MLLHHEIGHHVQTLMEPRQNATIATRKSKAEANKLSVH
jgi:predicted metalloprotease